MMLQYLVRKGSSPHARGAPWRSPRCAASPRDHPRMRGEHDEPIDRDKAMMRIIPACAGSTLVRPMK